ncbi:UNKNOWN [Stylonychia lemnae]|uniref:Uncharacterized protein n=1 Tax=Stylonychia lemnae TaxID=5949 RepID=A0A077ZXQ8_STYLE|nr:UNKNOWN [Stylonychia lemnae]|eukprot:CDW74695.1 UNKNOWN [Stylonychia lemnae]
MQHQSQRYQANKSLNEDIQVRPKIKLQKIGVKKNNLMESTNNNPFKNHQQSINQYNEDLKFHHQKLQQQQSQNQIRSEKAKYIDQSLDINVFDKRKLSRMQKIPSLADYDQEMEALEQQSLTTGKNSQLKKQFGLDEHDYQFFNEQKEINIRKAKKFSKFTLRESVEAMIERRESIEKKNQERLQMSIDYDDTINITMRQLQKKQESIKLGEDVLQQLKNRNTEDNIYFLQKQIQELSLHQGLKKGFSFSQAIREIKKDDKMSTRKKRVSWNERRVIMLNQFLQKYQEKFAVQKVNFMNKQESLIDFDQFLQSEKKTDIMKAFKESFRNMNNYSGQNNNKSLSLLLDDEEEKKVDQMYQQLFGKHSKESKSDIQNLNQKESRTKLGQSDSYRKYQINSISRLSVDNSNAHSKVRLRTLKYDKSIEQIRNNCKDIIDEYQNLNYQIGTVEQQLEKDNYNISSKNPFRKQSKINIVKA